MRLFGELLPFIGWRETFVDREGEPCCGPSEWYADCIEIEWFGFGAVIYIGDIHEWD